ncbi:hypothetical protein ACM66B_005465 [Microbotryomycetes sp. NB124-2]
MLDKYYLHEQTSTSRSSKRTRRGSATGLAHNALQASATGGTGSAQHQAGSSSCAAPAGGATATAAALQQHAAQHNDGQTAPTVNEKEARKQARMIRNRNAAQASRDRKKEHTAWLEARVAQLEAQLNLPPSMSPAAAAAPSPAAQSSSRHSSGHAASYHRDVSEAPSLTPAAEPVVVSDPADALRITELEDENETLRTRLQAEQDETTRLRKRLEALEDKFVRLEHFMSAPLSTSAPDPTASLPSPSSFSNFSDNVHDDVTMFGPINDPGLAAVDPAVSTDERDSVTSGDDHSGDFFPIDQLSVPSSPPSPSSCASVELQHLDAFTVKAAWSDWAHGLSTVSPNEMSGHVKTEDDELAGEFLDMTYLDGSSHNDVAAVN